MAEITEMDSNYRKELLRTVMDEETIERLVLHDLRTQWINSDPCSSQNLLVLMSNVKKCIITSIKSPFDFYIKFVDIELPFHKNMQTYYNNLESLVPLKSNPIFDVKLYLWKATNGHWERVRLTGINKATRNCRIFLIDVGTTVFTHVNELYELARQFSRIQPQAHRVYLLDIEETNKISKEDYIKGFQDLCQNKVYEGISTVKFHDSENSDFLENCWRFGVILTEVGSKCTLNSELCKLGFAEIRGLASSRYDLLDDIIDQNSPREIKCPDLTIEKLKILLNNPSLKLTNEDDIKIDQPIGFIRPGWDEDYTDNLSLPNSVKNVLTKCVTTYFLSPACFYIRPLELSQFFDFLQEYIFSVIESIEIIPNCEASIGEFVIVRVADYSPFQFYRGFVRCYLPEIGLLKVFLIDKGETCSIASKYVRRLPENLAQIPPLCYRVHLDGNNFYPASTSWNSRSNDICRKFLDDSVRRERCIYYWVPKKSSNFITLNDMCDDVQYDPASKIWSNRSIIQEAFTGDIKAQDLIRPFFTSIGIEIGFELYDGKSALNNVSLKVDKLTDILIDCGSAIRERRACKFKE